MFSSMKRMVDPISMVESLGEWRSRWVLPHCFHGWNLQGQPTKMGTLKRTPRAAPTLLKELALKQMEINRKDRALFWGRQIFLLDLPKATKESWNGFVFLRVCFLGLFSRESKMKPPM